MSVKYTMKNNAEKSEKSVFIRDKIMMIPFVCGKEYYFGKKFENALLYLVTFLMVLFGFSRQNVRGIFIYLLRNTQ